MDLPVVAAGRHGSRRQHCEVGLHAGLEEEGGNGGVTVVVIVLEHRLWCPIIG